jgi:hypothetical protein
MARALTFRFDTIGDIATASSRLRAWKLAEFLTEAGHSVLMNGGDRCDVFVCQKTRPFESLWRLKTAGALTVYDLDDHFLLTGPEGHGLKEEVVAFINAVDVVTVGSQRLLHAAKKYHPNVFRFENPVDVRTTELIRAKTAKLKRIGWFGTPAGLVQLRAVNTTEPISTITRGGDIEFDLEAVDNTLIEFDLLLFPVQADEWNLAKNANRMVKALALGVPVLASAVPEHVHAAKRFGLDDRFLVREGEAWDAKIAGFRHDFEAVQERTLRAREEVLKQNSLRNIGQNWLTRVERTLVARARGLPPKVIPNANQLSDCTLITFSHRADATHRDIELGGTTFGCTHHVLPPSPDEDFLKIFGNLWETVQSADRDWIVLAPNGFGLAYGFAREVLQAMRAHLHRTLFVVRSHKLGAPPDEWGAYALDLRETICHPRDPGVLIARREWLLKQPWRPAETLSYWTWLLVVNALSERTLGVVSTPVAWREGSAAVVNVCREYAISAKTLELPDSEAQWLRLSGDIFAQLAERLPEAVSASFARLIASSPFLLEGAAKTARVINADLRIQRELKAVYRSTSWRMTAPLRALSKGLQRFMGR